MLIRKKYSIKPTSFSISELGPISHYNGLIFNDMTALQADTEGALAVGGNTRFGSGTHGYDIGGAGLSGGDNVFIGKYENPDAYPSLLLGGTVSPESTHSNVFTGDVVMSLDHEENYENNDFRFGTAGVRFIEDDIIKTYFADVKAQAYATSATLPQGTIQTIRLADLREMYKLDLTKYENKHLLTDKRILVFNLESVDRGPIKIGELFLSEAVLEYDMVIINSSSTAITFEGGAFIFDGSIVSVIPRAFEGNELVERISSKFIFNFPNASVVRMNNYSLLGSMLAPNALVVGTGGSINGMLIADSLTQQGGMELHAFEIPLGEGIFDLTVLPGLGSAALIKIDSAPPYITLYGAVFSLYLRNEQTDQFELLFEDLTTGIDGTLIVEDLVPGTYKFIETQPPEDYRLPDNPERIFIIHEGGEVPQMEIIYIENELAKGSVEFIKIDSQNDAITLEGAIFDLYMLDTDTGEYELLETGLISGQNGSLIISGLLPGSYKLVETQAPPGYYLNPDNDTTFFTVTLDSDGEIIEEQPILIANSLLGSVEIIKVDESDPNIRLEGAVFDLYKYNAVSGQYDLIRTGLVSGSNGSIILSDLSPSDYKLVETKAPDGYRLPVVDGCYFSIHLN